MRIKIRLPQWLESAWDRYMAWVNVPLWTRGRFEVRRIDVGLAIGFVICVAYYSMYGWQSALAGGAMYVLMAMIALWIL